MKKIILTPFSVIFFFLSQNSALFAQKKNTLAFGLNVTNFRDWKKRPLNLFNPEIMFIKDTKKSKNILFSFDAFYGEFPRKQKSEVGSIIDRLNFNLKANYLFTKGNSFVGIGPSFRMRNEKKILYFYPPVNPFEAVIDPDKAHFDFGINANFLHTIPLNLKSKLFFKLSYSLHNKGKNPISLGFFYGRSW